MKIYVAGKITDFPDFKEKFEAAEDRLTCQEHVVLNPAKLPHGFTQEEYMHMCFAMIDVCDAVYFLNNWQDSIGAMQEYAYAVKNGKQLLYEE